MSVRALIPSYLPHDGIGFGHSPPDCSRGNANLSGISFNGADLAGANLTNTNLTGDDLSGANLSAASLAGTNLTNANFSQANLDDATGMSTSNVEGATWSATTCPDGTASTNDGGTCIKSVAH